MGLGRAFNTLVVGARVGMSFCSWRESLGLGVDSCWRELLGVLSEGVSVGGSCLVSCRRELLSEGVVCFTSRPLIFITCGWVGEASFGSRGARAGFECQRLYFCNGFFVATAFLEQRLLLAMVTVFPLWTIGLRCLLFSYFGTWIQKGALDRRKLGQLFFLHVLPLLQVLRVT